MDKLLDRMVSYLKKDDIDLDETEVIKYGLEIIILKFIFWMSSLSVGILMGCFIESVIYIALFTVLRSYAGGYHAKSRIKCFIQSMFTVIVAMLLLKLAGTYYIFSILLFIPTVFFSILIWKFAPVDTKNKILESDENIKFKKKTRIILSLEIILAFIAYYLDFIILSAPTMLAINTSGILLLVGYINKNDY